MADTSIFSRLKRLFSTDVIIQNTGGTDLRVVDINKIQQAGEIQTNSLFSRYQALYTNAPNSLYGQNVNSNYQFQRIILYSEYDNMDTDAIIASALDIIADESTLKSEKGEVIQIRSSDENVQKILYNLFYDVLNIEFNLWSWVRNMCKYGDFFLKLEIAEKFGVYNVIPYNAYHLERQEGFDKEKPQAIRYRFSPDGISSGAQTYGIQDNDSGMYFDNYEVAHFRLLSDTNYLPYGRSYIEPARKLFKQYILMEDAMLIHRIVRSSDKRVYHIDVGGLTPEQIEPFMQKTISAVKRTPYIDQTTGEYNLKYNLQNSLEDIFLPNRGGNSGTKLDVAPGLNYDGIKDVEYLRDKLFAALKVPKAFMGYEKDLTGKATLAAEDIRFARTIERIQRIITSELYKIALVHLYTQGYQGDNLTNFTLSLTTPSIIYDQERVALMKEKVDLAKNMVETKLFSSDQIYDEVFHYSDEQLDEIRDLVREDAKRAFRLDQIANEGNDPLESGTSYGTPHDLASLYGKGRMGQGDVPSGYEDKTPLGRPEEKVTNINTQENPLGKDRIGKKTMKFDDQVSQGLAESKDKKYSKIEYFKNKNVLSTVPNKFIKNTKVNLFEEDQSGESLLNENQIKD